MPAIKPDLHCHTVQQKWKPHSILTFPIMTTHPLCTGHTAGEAPDEGGAEAVIWVVANGEQPIMQQEGTPPCGLAAPQ